MDKERKPVGKKQEAGAGPDLGKLFKSSPTKIPRVARELALAAAPAVRWRDLALISGLVFLLVLSAYLITLWGGLVFNDATTLAFISSVRSWDDFWPRVWLEAIQSPLSQQWLKATYAWDFQAAGWQPAWYHLVNVGLHLIACLYFLALVFRLSFRFQREERLDADPYQLAFAAAAIYACHPLTAESVAYVSGRQAPLLAANYFLSLNCFLLGYLGRTLPARIWGWLLASLFLVIGLMVSNQALTLPATMLALAILLKEPAVSWLAWAQERMWSLAALVLAQGTLPYLALRGLVLPVGNGVGLPVLPGWEYVATQLKALAAYYLRCFVLPLGLSIEPPLASASSWADPLTILGLVVLVASLVGMWIGRSRPIFCLALLLFLIGLVPDLFIPQPEVVADRRFYLSLSGPCLMAGWLVARLGFTSFRRYASVCGVMLVTLLALTIWRNIEWQSNLSLCRATLRVNPKSGRAHALMAIELTRRGETAEAAVQAKEALALNSQSALSFLAVGSVLISKNDFHGARDAFAQALDLASRQKLSADMLASCQAGLAESYLGLEEADHALACARAVLDSEPANARMHYVSGKAYLAEQSYQNAYFELTSAIKADQALTDALPPLIQAALELGLTDTAYDTAKALNLRDRSPASRILLARVLMFGGRLRLAEMVLERVVKENPRNAEALVLLSLVEDKLGHKEKAKSCDQKAFELDPLIHSKVQPAKTGASSEPEAGPGSAGSSKSTPALDPPARPSPTGHQSTLNPTD